MATRRALSILLSSVLALSTAPLILPGAALADVPGTWEKTDGVNEITPALTESTTTFDDDEASEFVHQIQWDYVPGWTEATWKADADKDTSPGVQAQEALDWVFTNIAYQEDETNYVVAEAWANPEQTLNQGSGDCEDMAFLLASLLKWHTDEVDAGGGDLVYAKCGFLLPPDGGFHAWVFWYDASAVDWHQLDPTSGAMNHILYPALGTLWLDDEHVFGFLPDYYPGPYAPVGGYGKDDFTRIAEGGFGDPINNYAWSMAEFNGDLYVGTGRNVPYMLISMLLFGLLPPGYEFEYITQPGGEPGSEEWAEDMRGEIWRYHDGMWQRVYRSPVVEGSFYPEEAGFRQMATFTDRHGEAALYAASGVGLLPGRLLLKSTDGTTWEKVVTDPGMGTDSRAMAVHNGKLYVGTGNGGNAQVWATDEPSTTGNNWEEVADFTNDDPTGDADSSNTAVESLESFNGYLYAGTQNTENGFQVFRSLDQSPDDPQPGEWARIVEYGGSDVTNYWAGTMEVFNNKLYVGTLSLPVRAASPVELIFPKGFELIRIDTGDNWELVIGDYIPREPPPGGPVYQVPQSGWPAGFGNLFNFYCWSLQAHDGVLYLGTFDSSSFLRFIPVEMFAGCCELTPEEQEQMATCLEQLIGLLEELGADEDCIEPLRQLLEVFQTEPLDWVEVWRVFTDWFTGGDLWKSDDGVRWQPVTLNGLDNPDNYGFRTMVSGSLYLGTSNPFQEGGCEVWTVLATPQGEATDAAGLAQDSYALDENVYATASGFPSNNRIDVYVVPDRAWSDGDGIPDDVGDGMDTFTTDGDGNLGPVVVWEAPLVPGEYDLVFDIGQDGVYDASIDHVDHPNHPGFIVERPPERPLERPREEPHSPAEPARMVSCYLNVSPQEVLPRQQVEISVNMCNRGSEKGSRSVALMINGHAEQSQTVVVSPGSCQEVVFRTFKTVPGSYEVWVEGATGSFSVMPLYPGYVVREAPPAESRGIGTAGIVTIVIVLIVLGVGLVLILRR